jgi:hypothetical protein
MPATQPKGEAQAQKVQQDLLVVNAPGDAFFFPFDSRLFPANAS